MTHKPGTLVVDVRRKHLYGEATGRVVTPLGPYHTQVEWSDERGIQIEKNEDLTPSDAKVGGPSVTHDTSND